MKYVYGIFGMGYKLELSTRPKKALGDIALWNRAGSLASAMDDAGKGGWRVNPGDGAFWTEDRHQGHGCAGSRAPMCLIQLDSVAY